MRNSLILLCLLLCAKVGLGQTVNFCSAKTPSPIIFLQNQNPGTTTKIHDIIINAGSSAAIHLRNCSNFHITRVTIIGNNTNFGVWLEGCHAITIDTVSFSNTTYGVFEVNCTGGIITNNNQTWDIHGSTPATVSPGHAFQLDACTGTGYEVSYNSIDNPTGTGSNPRPQVGDAISMYKTYGGVSGAIKIYGNRIRNGGTSIGVQADGITLGDNGGSGQDAENNVIVNSGYSGLTIAAGQNMIAKNNTIYGANNPWSAAGLTSANFTLSTGVTSSIVSNNVINWFAGETTPPQQRDLVYKAPGNPLPTGWSTNVTHAPINANILPAVIIQTCSNLTFPPLPSQIYGNPDFFGNATSSNPVSYFSSNTAIATIVSGKIHIVAAGTCTISATDNIDTIGQGLVVNKAGLVIAANSASRPVGVANPTFTASYFGFVYGQNNSVLTAQPTFTCSATTGSPAAAYLIVPCCAAGANYNIAYVNGTLLVGFVVFTIPGPRVVPVH